MCLSQVGTCALFGLRHCITGKRPLPGKWQHVCHWNCHNFITPELYTVVGLMTFVHSNIYTPGRSPSGNPDLYVNGRKGLRKPHFTEQWLASVPVVPQRLGWASGGAHLRGLRRARAVAEVRRARWMDWAPLQTFAAILAFFHTSEFLLAWTFMRQDLSPKCEPLDIHAARSVLAI